MMTQIELIRLSLGTAIKLGLEQGPKLDYFTTCFLMTYHKGGCSANCSFCPQARECDEESMLSRIEWPAFAISEVFDRLRTTDFKRICIQCLNYPNVTQDVQNIVRGLRAIVSLPISVCIQPITIEEMRQLKQVGVTDIGIAMDAATPEIFNAVKGHERNGPYEWGRHLAGIEAAKEIFGQGHVTTHLIIGLGESERDAAEFLLRMHELGIRVGLFAFTNIKGTPMANMPQPELKRYRRIQVLRHLLHRGLINRELVEYDKRGRIMLRVDKDWLLDKLSSGVAFRVSGCPGCNRPYYNERPRGTMYNYPRPLKPDEVKMAIDETELVI